MVQVNNHIQYNQALWSEDRNVLKPTQICVWTMFCIAQKKSFFSPLLTETALSPLGIWFRKCLESEHGISVNPVGKKQRTALTFKILKFTKSTTRKIVVVKSFNIFPVTSTFFANEC